MMLDGEAPATVEPVNSGEAPAPRKDGRLTSLDVVRGFTVLLMIFVDNAGSAYACVNHSPWNGLTLADVVMPFFLFMVGCSVPLALAKRRAGAARKVAARTAKLLVLGVVLQGGGLPSGASYAWGYDLTSFRVCGILQRIAVAYGAVAALELATPRADAGDAPVADAPFAAAAGALLAVYVAVTYATFVPSYTLSGGGGRVDCDARGSLGVACNAAGLVDRALFGKKHLYSGGAWVRLPRCSSCSPGDCPRDDAPGWCRAAHHGVVDPEGAISTTLAVATTIFGALFGRTLARCRPRPAGADGADYRLLTAKAPGRAALLRRWSVAAAALVAAALCCQAAGLPWNKQLWTPTYALGTAGLCGGVLATTAFLVGDLRADDAVDAPLFAASRRALEPLRRVGKNALLVFVLGASDVFDMCLAVVFVPGDRGQKFNVVDGARNVFRETVPGRTPQDAHARADLLFSVAKVLFWAAVGWVLDARGVYWTA